MYVFLYVLVPLARVQLHSCQEIRITVYWTVFQTVIQTHKHSLTVIVFCLLSETCWTQSERMSLLINSTQSTIIYFQMVCLFPWGTFSKSHYIDIDVLIFVLHFPSKALLTRLFSSSSLPITFSSTVKCIHFNWQELFHLENDLRILSEINVKMANIRSS